MEQRRRRRRGFERVGADGVEGLAISPSRRRELRLALLWREAAGAALAERARLEGLRRGVLEVRTSAGAWAETLRPLLPRLAGRVASAAPELGIRRCRLLLDDGAADEPRPIES